MNNIISVDFQNDLAVISLNNPPVNVASQKLRAGLFSAIDQINAQKQLRAVILYAVGSTFISGGDISEFGGEPPEPHLPDLVNAIEAHYLPWIASLHGSVFGGGFEIALACDFRIATHSTKFAFPEVNLGLIPGAGGSQRLPRLVSIKEAASILADGKPRSAVIMQQLGAIDAIMDGEPLDNARTFATNLPTPPLALSKRDCKKEDVTPIYEQYQKGCEAPRLNIEAVEWAGRYDFTEGQQKERVRHLALRKSKQSRALQYVFFAERSAKKLKILEGLIPRSLENITLFGGGLMGTGIATACLLAGKIVTIIERDDTQAEAAFTRVQGLLEGAQKQGKLKTSLDIVYKKFSTGSDISAVADADLVIEAVFEDVAAKQELLERVASRIRQDAIVTTNTSYLNPEIIIPRHLQAQSAGLHFFSPAHIMRLVEVVRLGHTPPQIMADLFFFVGALRKQPVMSGICDGFIGNRILVAYRRQADYLLADGALPEDIDLAMRDFGMSLGPYEAQDLSGLQIAWARRKHLAKTRDPKIAQIGEGTEVQPKERYIAIADQLCEAGRLGKRNHAGWYDYPNGKKKNAPSVHKLIEEFSQAQCIQRASFDKETIQNRLLAVMFNESIRIFEEGVAQEFSDIDVVQTAGYGFPRWKGGVCFHGEENIKTMQGAMRDVIEQSPNSWKISKRLL